MCLDTPVQARGPLPIEGDLARADIRGRYADLDIQGLVYGKVL